MSTLNVYPAPTWHDPILIVGSTSGIEALRDACQAALNAGHGGSGGSAEVFCGDGEGYALLVEIRESEEIELLPTHYTEDYAYDPRAGAIERLVDIRFNAYQRHLAR